MKNSNKLVRSPLRNLSISAHIAHQFKGPFRIITLLGSRVILPTEYADWVRKCPDVSHQALVAEVFDPKL